MSTEAGVEEQAGGEAIWHKRKGKSLIRLKFVERTDGLEVW